MQAAADALCSPECEFGQMQPLGEVAGTDIAALSDFKHFLQVSSKLTKMHLHLQKSGRHYFSTCVKDSWATNPLNKHRFRRKTLAKCLLRQKSTKCWVKYPIYPKIVREKKIPLICQTNSFQKIYKTIYILEHSLRLYTP